MSRNKRKSESLSKEITKEQFDKALITYSQNDIKLSQLNAELEEEIQAIKEDFSSDIDLVKAEQALLFATIKAYSVEKRHELMTDKMKSFDTLYAKIGFRKDPPSIKTLSGVTLDILTARLKEQKLDAYVRTVEEPNKELLLADRDKEELSKKFSALGIKVAQEEKFYVELKKLEVTA
ncbi:host-nuclease inhibitor Gam family protein [Flavipsychrobacter stenotrophus]|nr:host-nuclease inhibitor Gam family protein [Flavipsychrobacter stenotrophus]